MKETTLGLDIQTHKGHDSKFLRTAHDILSITAQRFFQPWIQPSAFFWLSKYFTIFQNAVNDLNALLEQVLHPTFFILILSSPINFLFPLSAVHIEKAGVH